LINEAMRLFIEKGFTQTTVAEVTEAADLATGTFYNYFQSKEDVIRSALAEKNLEAEKSLNRVAASTATASKKLLQIARLMGKLMEKNKSLFQLLIHLPPMGAPPHGDRFKDVLAAVIHDGQINGELGKDFSVDMACEAFMALVQSAMISKTGLGFEVNMNYKLQILMHGLSA